MKTASSTLCPQCNKPLAASSLQGLCPECLLRAGFATGTQAIPKTAPFVPPAPAELARLFPQLEIIELIGHGGMGAVYRARQPTLDRIVALKILPPHAGRSPGFTERFNREARTLARLSHPNIVAVHEFGSVGDYPYFVMEYVDGVTLRHLLTTARPGPREALAIVPQICDALQFAHDRGVVHRDIKPENILLDRHGTVKIADFGLAKLVGGETPDLSITSENDVMGTPHYMAPEQVEQPLAVDHRADIYSLGVVFYQMLTGELPLGRFAPPSRKVLIDVRLDEIVLRALEKEPERRYQHASGLRTEIDSVAATAARADKSAGLDTDRLSFESVAMRWSVLACVWALLGFGLWQHAGLVDRYLANASDLSPTTETPFRQIYPSFASDAQTWVRHALALLEGDSLQLRHTTIDNAPKGREVHWNSLWAWCIAGAGKLHHWLTGLPLPQAVERSTLWLAPTVFLGLTVALSSWAARRLGLVAGVLVAVMLVCHDRIFEGFFPGYVDHHGLLTLAVFGLLLGAAVMRAGWWRRSGNAQRDAATRHAVRSAAIFSAAAGGLGLWIGAASVIPSIALVGIGGLLAVVFSGRAAARRGEVFAAEAWRLWGRVGAGVSFAAYLLEYFPTHTGVRMEVNHPFYALAWLWAGELIAALGERWLTPERFRPLKRTLLVSAAGLALAPLALMVGGSKVFVLFDPFVGTLYRDYVQEFQPLWKNFSGLGGLGQYQMLLVGNLPLLAAITMLAYLRRESSPVLWLGTLVTAALTLMAWMQARWLLPATAASLVLIIVLLAHGTATERPALRWVFASAILIVFFLPSAVFRHTNAAYDIANSRVSPSDATGALYRDIAAALRRSQPRGDIVLLASPNASSAIGYYGRFKTIGTLYWENGEGLRAAAEIFSAADSQEAAKHLRARGVTHIALISKENFILPYRRLLQESGMPDSGTAFGYSLLHGQENPAFLLPIHYEQPAVLSRLAISVRLFKVALD